MKILIVRLSSIGDIIQCMSVVGGIKEKFPDSELHWVVRSDLAQLLKIDPRIDRIWEFDRKLGMSGWLKMAQTIRIEKFDLVYDAHQNIRSNILKWILFFSSPLVKQHRPKIITRYKERFKRFLLFQFRINKFPQPNLTFNSFRLPLQKVGVENFSESFYKWVFPTSMEERIKELVIQPMENKNWVTLVPSAAWELKRWPIDHWKQLIALRTDLNFVLLGGPTDLFCDEIKAAAPSRVLNLAGKTNLMESFCVIYHSLFVISNDTGFLHAADLFNRNGIALLGPTAFGYPSSDKIKVLEISLPCRPCTKEGNSKCKLKENKKCLVDIRPIEVANKITVNRN